KTGLSAEFPFGRLTSLLQMKTAEPHPRFGHGLLILQSLPQVPHGESAEAAELALKLNESEQDSTFFGHFLGSWCPGTHALTFATFCPNFLYAPSLAVNLAMNAVRRAWWAATQAFDAGWDFDQAWEFRKTTLGLTGET